MSAAVAGSTTVGGVAVSVLDSARTGLPSPVGSPTGVRRVAPAPSAAGLACGGSATGPSTFAAGSASPSGPVGLGSTFAAGAAGGSAAHLRFRERRLDVVRRRGPGSGGADARAGAGRSAMTGAPTAALGAAAGSRQDSDRTRHPGRRARAGSGGHPARAWPGRSRPAGAPIAVSSRGTRVRSARQAGHEPRADGFHDLVEERPRRPGRARRGRRGSPGPPGRRRRRAPRRTRRPPRRSARPSVSRTAVRAEAVRVAGQELVEHRLGVPHPAGGGPGDEVDRVVVRLPADLGEDVAELAGDLLDGELAEVVALDARQDRRPDAARHRSCRR